jgi:hypothetical protein
LVRLSEQDPPGDTGIFSGLAYDGPNPSQDWAGRL